MPTSRSRKRTREGSDADNSSKRSRTTSFNGPPSFNREGSPNKSVQWSRELIRGPSESDPIRRSQSPVRPAIHKRDQCLDSPSAQLQAEQREAHCLVPTNAKRKTPDKTKVANPRRESLSSQTSASRKTSKTEKPLSKQPRKQQSPQRAKRGKLQGVPDVLAEDIDLYEAVGQTHEGICREVNDLRTKVMDFAKSFPSNRSPDVLSDLVLPEHHELVRYIGCLAIGGKSGVEGWEHLLADTTCRHALVSGVIGRALKEHVFDELCFGAEPALLAMLDKKQQEQFQQDGFFRTKMRADTIATYERKMITVSGRQRAAARVTSQLERILLPLWVQGGSRKTWIAQHRQSELADIVLAAAHLSQDMRRDRSTVYHWPPTFKDEEFEPNRMECFNLEIMIRNSPYERKAIKGVERAILQEGHEYESEAIVRVICFPGLVTYQQGGGYLARQQSAEEEGREDNAPPDVQQHRRTVSRTRGGEPLTADDGIRTRVLCKSSVLLQWGKQRLLTKEAGTSRHMDAVKSGSKRYEQDYQGFVELYDILLQELPPSQRTQLRGQSQPPQPTLLANLPRLFSRSPSAGPEDADKR